MKFKINKLFAVLLLAASMFIDIDSKRPALYGEGGPLTETESAKLEAAGGMYTPAEAAKIKAEAQTKATQPTIVRRFHHLPPRGRFGGRYARRGRHCTRRRCNNNVTVTGKVSPKTRVNRVIVCKGTSCKKGIISMPARVTTVTPRTVRTTRGTFQPSRYGRRSPRFGRYSR